MVLLNYFNFHIKTNNLQRTLGIVAGFRTAMGRASSAPGSSSTPDTRLASGGTGMESAAVASVTPPGIPPSNTYSTSVT